MKISKQKYLKVPIGTLKSLQQKLLFYICVRRISIARALWSYVSPVPLF